MLYPVNMFNFIKVKKYKKTSRATSALDTSVVKLLSVLYNVWFSIYIHSNQVVNASDSGSRGRGFDPNSGQTVLCP